ncbi:EAL domain-containing protein [Roseovarius indicus]|uniref:Cyclic di-GMP phosphodiesterase Gmr n=1 Tax=Roseovarius indicus TaxID=540747 RepID=A0A0T5PEG5_9RHOB|nr:EAL domain-containing protein [Roseovarius indicus]KRS19639.1 diguanylate phosphodiesterase [Roseovarius indicus]QEW29024.1 Cyclic di-GMP phosphodiesterase Gmr [Roseovarius indicus]SFD81111.1 EAL domain, c-di-GMP-specific phosphodiesterase class I (or its enzymatically inactive variant) [Roseovarius indicus]
MGYDAKTWADIPAGHDNPLNFAVTSRDRQLIEMVTDAVKNDRVMLAYQAIVPAGAPARPALYEGLIRVMDTTGRIIPACDFIAEIEATETGRIIDCIALEQGLKAMHDYPDLRLAINMSARSIGYPRWNEILRRGLRGDPTAGERLILEITESSAMLVPELVVSFMTDLQSEGVSFALDDFGSGYTSFRYLKSFYFDILKIDGQFIRGVAHDPDNQVLTNAMLSIAEQFDMICIAESVETAEDAHYLQRIGMDCLQGYFFGAPTVRPPWDTTAWESASA